MTALPEEQPRALPLVDKVHPYKRRFLFVEKAFMHLEMDGLCKALTFSLTATNGLLSMICFHNPLNAAS